MEYTNTYCVKANVEGFHCRFVLGKFGAKPIIVIGLNPSIADETQPDTTMRKLLGFLTKWNTEGISTHDSFIMLNLYPLIETNSGELRNHKFNETLLNRNLEIISSILKEHPTADILLCYGDAIEDIPKLKECRDAVLNILSNFPHLTLHQLGDLTVRLNPRHPSRLAYSTPLKPFVNPFLTD